MDIVGEAEAFSLSDAKERYDCAPWGPIEMGRGAVNASY
jgi:hypothetical protein